MPGSLPDLPDLSDLPPLPPAGGTARAPSRGSASTSGYSRPEKAAIVVRAMLAEGITVPLRKLPDDVQLALSRQMSGMANVDPAAVEAVIDEFLGEIDEIGLTFPRDRRAAASLLGTSLSPSAAARLRAEAGIDYDGDPWAALADVEADEFLPVFARESTEVGAVILSKLHVQKAAGLLGKLPGDQARRLAFAVSRVGAISPDLVRRIGVCLAEEFGRTVVEVFEDGPVARVGAILNSSLSSVRDDLLAGLEEADKGFAEEVRKSIFTFANIRARVAKSDIPKVQRGIAQADLITVLAGVQGPDKDSADHILDNISQRMADAIRTEAAERKKPKTDELETAMAAIVAVIRGLEEAGEIFLISEEEEAET